MAIPRMQVLVALTALMTSSCALDRVSLGGGGCTTSASCDPGQQCLDGRCVEPVDAHVEIDAGSDASFDADVDAATDASVDGGTDAGTDAGPEHCRSGALDGDETDVDCGGSCAACDSCERCNDPADCATGGCTEGRCAVVLSSIVTPTGATIPAFVRDGAVLLAHYGPGTYHSAYNPHQAQITSRTGGSVPPAGWAPDPCRETGHLDFRSVAPVGRATRMECGADLDDRPTSISSTLFDSFEFGDYGTVGGAGVPGWAMIASIGSGRGRSSHASCGGTLSSALGGVAYCNGAPNVYANHVVSYAVGPAGYTYVGCGGSGCNGPTCPTHVWIWAEAP